MISFSNPMPVKLQQPRTAVQMSEALEGAAAVAKLKPRDSAIISIAGSLTAPLEFWDVGKAAIGHGQVGGALQVLGGVSVAVGAYKSVKGLLQHISPDAISQALEKQNGGRPLEAADAQMLADHINSRARINSTIGLGNAIASGTAIATGNLGAGLIAFAFKVGGIGSAIYSTTQTVKDIQEVLQHQPSAPAPAPQAPPAPAPAQP